MCFHDGSFFLPLIALALFLRRQGPLDKQGKNITRVRREGAGRFNPSARYRTQPPCWRRCHPAAATPPASGLSATARLSTGSGAFVAVIGCRCIDWHLLGVLFLSAISIYVTTLHSCPRAGSDLGLRLLFYSWKSFNRQTCPALTRPPQNCAIA